MKKTTKRWLLRSAGILVVLWLGFVGFVDWAMHQPPEVFGRVMMHMPMPAYFLFPFETMWTQARFGHVNPGGLRSRLHRANARKPELPSNLASLWSTKPVVLVFGSYT